MGRMAEPGLGDRPAPSAPAPGGGGGARPAPGAGRAGSFNPEEHRLRPFGPSLRYVPFWDPAESGQVPDLLMSERLIEIWRKKFLGVSSKQVSFHELVVELTFKEGNICD
jgi:hypothetical protein